MKAAAAFAVAAWAGFVAISAITIFGFDSFERIYGKWGTFNMVLWLTIPFAVICGAGALAGLKGGSAGPRVKVPNERLFPTVALYALFVAATFWVTEALRMAWLFWLSSFVSAAAAGWILARRSANSPED